MEPLVYSLPCAYIRDNPTVIADLRGRKRAILEQLPKRARQTVSRHLALGHLELESVPKLGMTFVANKKHNAILSAVGLDVRYPTLTEMLSCYREVKVHPQEGSSIG